MPGLTQATSIGIGVSHIWASDFEGGVAPGRELLLLESGITDSYLLESGDYYLLET